MTDLAIVGAGVTECGPGRPPRVELRLSRELDAFELLEAQRASQPGQSLLFEDVQAMDESDLSYEQAASGRVGPDRLIVSPAWSSLPPKFWQDQVAGIAKRGADARAAMDVERQLAQEIADAVNAAVS